MRGVRPGVGQGGNLRSEVGLGKDKDVWLIKAEVVAGVEDTNSVGGVEESYTTMLFVACASGSCSSPGGPMDLVLGPPPIVYYKKI
jgi:hypothetical protein